MKSGFKTLMKPKTARSSFLLSLMLIVRLPWLMACLIIRIPPMLTSLVCPLSCWVIHVDIDYMLFPNSFILTVHNILQFICVGMPFTVRSVFFLDPSNKIRATLTYPASSGRNFDEILRLVDSLITSDKHKIATPVSWKVGEAVIVPPTVSTEDAIKKFGKVNVIKPYLRTVQLE